MTVAQRDVQTVASIVKAAEKDEFVQSRISRNVLGSAPSFSKEKFWYAHIGCLLTTQQRSTSGTPVERFLAQEPFPLELGRCACQNLQQFVRDQLTEFGGIRRAPTIGNEAQTNLRFLGVGGWELVQRLHGLLAIQRSMSPEKKHITLEREAARFIDEALKGFGPKQARNLWQWLGLTRYEIPLDSRVADWINENMSSKVDTERLAQVRYYEMILDYLQEVCLQAKVLPCVFDAAVFNFENKNQRKPSCSGSSTRSPDVKPAKRYN